MRSIVLVCLTCVFQPAQTQAPVVASKDNPELAKLLQTLDQGNDEQRWQALLDLADLGSAAAPALPRFLKLLSSTNPHLRLASCLALGKAGPTAVPALIKLLEGSDLNLQYHACWALGDNGVHAKTALPALLKACQGKDVDVARRAVIALGQIGLEPKMVVPVLLNSVTPGTREAVSEAIARFGSAASPFLHPQLSQGNREAALLALDALAAMKPPPWDDLLGALKSKEIDVRRRLVDHLDARGGTHPQVVAGLAQALADTDYETTVAAHIALGRRGAAALVAVPALTEAMFGPDALNHARSLETFRSLGHDPRPDLRKELQSKDARRRALAAFWLVARLDESGEAEKILDKELAVKDDDLRREIAKELFRRKGANNQLIPVLVHFLKNDKSSEARFRALQALHQLAATNDAALPAMAQALDDLAPDVRADAARFLGDHGPRARIVLPALRAALNDPVPAVRARVQTAIEQIEKN